MASLKIRPDLPLFCLGIYDVICGKPMQKQSRSETRNISIPVWSTRLTYGPPVTFSYAILPAIIPKKKKHHIPVSRKMRSVSWSCTRFVDDVKYFKLQQVYPRCIFIINLTVDCVYDFFFDMILSTVISAYLVETWQFRYRIRVRKL